MIDAAFAGVNSGLADQLYQTAKLIAARASLGVARQGFFTSMGGYDTHNEQRSELKRPLQRARHPRSPPSSARSTASAWPTR